MRVLNHTEQVAEWIGDAGHANAPAASRTSLLLVNLSGVSKPRILQTRRKFVSYFSKYTRSENALMLIEKLFRGFRIALRKLAQRPRQSLHYHIVSIRNQRGANYNRARRITAAPASFVVQRYGADQRRATPPSVP